MSSVLVLGDSANLDLVKDFQWTDGPSEITLMLRVDEKGNVEERLLTDGNPKLVYDYTFRHSRTSTQDTGMDRVALFLIKGANYLFTMNVIRVNRNLRLEDVFQQWIGFSPKFEIAAEPAAEAS